MAERSLIRNDSRITSHIVQDAHDPSTVYVETTDHDAQALDQIQRVKQAELLSQGQAFGAHEGAVLEYAFSIPSTWQWARFKRDHPDIARGLHSPNDTERLKAARRLALMKPQWVVMNAKL